MSNAQEKAARDRRWMILAPEWTVGKRDVAKVGRKGYGRGGKKDVAKASNWADSSQWCNTNNQSLGCQKALCQNFATFRPKT